MVEINITNEEIEQNFEKIHNEVLKINKIKEKQLEKNENNLKIIDAYKRNFLESYIDLFNANILETVITLVTSKINELFNNQKIMLNQDQEICLDYFMNIFTSHVQVLRNFEFFNIAILAKYLLEACTRILENKKNLKNFFKELTYKEHVEKFEKNHKTINKQIEKHLKKVGKKLYKDANVFSHPTQGKIYAIKTSNQFRINNRCLSILLTTYYVVINKIFNIFNINFNLDFFFEVAEINTEINENFKDYLKENKN